MAPAATQRALDAALVQMDRASVELHSVSGPGAGARRHEARLAAAAEAAEAAATAERQRGQTLPYSTADIASIKASEAASNNNNNSNTAKQQQPDQPESEQKAASYVVNGPPYLPRSAMPRSTAITASSNPESDTAAGGLDSDNDTDDISASSPSDLSAAALAAAAARARADVSQTERLAHMLQASAAGRAARSAPAQARALAAVAAQRERQARGENKLVCGRAYETPVFTFTPGSVDFPDFAPGKQYARRITATNVSFGPNSIRPLPCPEPGTTQKRSFVSTYLNNFC